MAEPERGSLRNIAIAAVVGAVIAAAALLVFGGGTIADLFRDDDFAYVRLSSEAGACTVGGYDGERGARLLEKSSFVYSDRNRRNVTWYVVNDSAVPCWVLVGAFETRPTTNDCREPGAAYPFSRREIEKRTILVDPNDSRGLKLPKLRDEEGPEVIYYSLCTAANESDARNGGTRVDDPMLRVKR
jgi:hypothetical protein